ncbi:DUF2076 domain-containing protein [Paractinoplanes durhamensis]|uniref:DUF1542 domain-containing protein n=1 Tax=Paractinoplanes durhamensis TaxID=113563 RepID=A0ABQ3YX73_9ACTN|nr:hypothetical protein [Actinoplanes durhamensis]GIE02190.1 hypothetical protein Adu01nite_35400 [Actinoplanes durhamensis]
MMILVLFAMLGIGVAALVGGGRRGATSRNDQSVADARAEAQRWYERLGGQLVNLSADSAVARQALADAAERHQAAGSQLATANTIVQYQLAQETALEGLAYVRAARTALGLDPGPELPPLAAARGVGTITEEREVNGYVVGPRSSAATPYYYPGGYVQGRPVPAGWYSTPWWKTALGAAAGTVGGMLIFESLFGHHGPGGFGGGPGGPGGFDLF